MQRRLDQPREATRRSFQADPKAGGGGSSRGSIRIRRFRSTRGAAQILYRSGNPRIAGFDEGEPSFDVDVSLRQIMHRIV